LLQENAAACPECVMHLARQDALAPYSGGRSRPKTRGYVTVREPAKGFFIAGSNIDDMNGIYAAIRPDNLKIRRQVQVAYRNDSSGWTMALVKAPPQTANLRRRRQLDKSRLPAGVLPDSSDSDDAYSDKFEWIFMDPLGRERFAHKGDTIIPGAGLRWRHLHREVSSSKVDTNLPQLYWHECLEDNADFETADELEESLKITPAVDTDVSHQVPTSECRAIMEPVKDDEDELPWQVIAVLDGSVIRDLRYSYRRYERTVAAARAGTNLPKPAPHTLEYCCQQPRCWVYRVVAPGGVILRTQPRSSAKSCGQRGCGQYVCGAEIEGCWLHLAPSRRLTESDSEEQVDQWVCLKEKDGKALLEAVRDSDVGCSKAPVENDPQAEKFDRPFEPRIQAPDYQAPSTDAGPGADVDMKGFEDKDEHSPGILEEPAELVVGGMCILQGLTESSRNGQPCIICKLPRDDGRCLVQLSDGPQIKLAVKPSNLRPIRGPKESEQSYYARILGLTPGTLGLIGAPSESAACLQSLKPAEILSAALRAAQRDLPDAPDALLESQEAYEKLILDFASVDSMAPGSRPFPPHVLVENGLLGTRAAHAATNAASQQSIKSSEAGIAGLRQVLSDEHRRLAREAGLAWPLPAACKSPSEGSDALRLRLTLVRALLCSRQEAQAALEAEACVRRHPHGAASLLWAGRCLLRIGRREHGRKYLSMAEQSGGSGADGSWGLQGATMRLQALAKVERCKLAAEDAYGYGDFQTAAARYGEAIIQSPTDDKWGRATLHAARAACHRRAREFRQAVDDCDAALALFPNYARALFRRAACLIEAGRPSEAVKSLEGLLRVDRSWPNLCDWLVRAHALAKRLDNKDTFKASWKRGRRSRETAETAGTPEVGSDLYAILGVSADATDQQLKRAYRLMSLKYHPDKQGGSTRDFQRIATAYETLSDPAKRHAYDEGADLKKPEDDSEESEREEKSLREEVERKYFPERFKYWPFGDPFIEKRKLLAQRKRDAERKSRPTPDRDDDW